MDELISPGITREIEAKTTKLNDNLAAPEIKSKRMVRALENLGDLYSFWINNPALRMGLLNGKRYSVETIKKKSREGIRNIKDAWYYLENLKQSKNRPLISIISPESLGRINAIVMGNAHGKPTPLRTKDVSLGWGGYYTPPSFERVPEMIEQMLYELKTQKAAGLEKAFYATLKISGIQPFIEGNKRTARLVQNSILEDYGYPHAEVPSGEGKFYFDLLKHALIDSRDGRIGGQKRFYDYLASKVNNVLDVMLNDIFEDRTILMQ